MIKLFRTVVALASGAVFGSGLALSGMLDPTRVRGFLDVAGAWDPSLVFVLGGAVAVATAGYRLSRRADRPVLDDRFHLPRQQRIDRRLVLGSALFGIGWGMAGLCPGPAIADLAMGLVPVMVFVAAMAGGMAVYAMTAGREGPRS